MFKERMPLVMLAVLAVAAARVEVAAAQERKPGIIPRVQQPAPILVAEKPDLTCTAFVSRDEAGTQPIAMNRTVVTDDPQVWVHRAARNEGQSSVGPFSAHIKIAVIGDSYGAPQDQVVTIGPLPPGGSHTWPAVPVPLPPSTDRIEVRTYVDPVLSVDESNEGNNDCTTWAHVQTPPPGKPKDQVASKAAQEAAQPGAQAVVPGLEQNLKPEGLAAMPGVKALLTPAPDVTCTTWASRHMDGSGLIPSGDSWGEAVAVEEDEIYLHVTVRNLGQAEAQNFIARSQVYEYNVPEPYTDELITLEPGLVYRDSHRIDLCDGVCNVGIHVLTDPSFALPESNESNNECRVKVRVYNPED